MCKLYTKIGTYPKLLEHTEQIHWDHQARCMFILPFLDLEVKKWCYWRAVWNSAWEEKFVDFHQHSFDGWWWHEKKKNSTDEQTAKETSWASSNIPVITIRTTWRSHPGVIGFNHIILPKTLYSKLFYLFLSSESVYLARSWFYPPRRLDLYARCS